MSSVTPENKALSRHVAAAIGGEPRVRRAWDDNHRSHVDILSCADRPVRGVTTYGTIGLSDSPLIRDGREYGVRLELITASRSTFSHMGNALATAAFCVINSKWFCYPGAVFGNVLSMYKASTTMKHFLFVPPYLWEDALTTQTIGRKRVTWLLAVPISDEERAFAERQGADVLETLFERKQIDIYDVGRPSVA